MSEKKIRQKKFYNGEFFRVLVLCLFLVALCMLWADYKGATSWLEQKFLPGEPEEYVKYDINVETENGKTIYLGTTRLWGEDARIKNVTAKERERGLKKSGVVKLKIPQTISWLFR